MAISDGSTPTCSTPGDLEHQALPNATLRPPLYRSITTVFPFPTYSPITPGRSSQTHSPPKSPAKPASTISMTSTLPPIDRAHHDYHTTAQSMHHFRHLTIFRRFGHLSMTSLLAQQSAIASLESQLRSASPPDRIHLTQSLQSALKNYYESLLLQDAVFSNLEPPRSSDARLLNEVAASDLYDSSHQGDFIALGLSGRDAVEKLVGRLVPRLFPHRTCSAEDVRTRSRSAEDIASVLSPFTRRMTRLLIAVMTAAAMLGPMAVLGYVDNPKWKLGWISIFTVILALGVAVGMRGRGEAVVMVVAAYAAVLVVFVQNEQGGPRGSGSGSGSGSSSGG